MGIYAICVPVHVMRVAAIFANFGHTKSVTNGLIFIDESPVINQFSLFETKPEKWTLYDTIKW